MAKKKQAEKMVCIYCEGESIFETDNFGTMSEHVKTVHPEVFAASVATAAPSQPQRPAAATGAAPAGWPANVPLPGAPDGGRNGSFGFASVIVPPKKENFLNFQTLQQFGYKVQATVKSIEQGTGRFGPGWNLRLDNGWVLTVKLNGENHEALFNAYGMEWIGKTILIQPGMTQRGSAKIEVLPVTPPVARAASPAPAATT